MNLAPSEREAFLSWCAKNPEEPSIVVRVTLARILDDGTPPELAPHVKAWLESGEGKAWLEAQAAKPTA